jgi:membrane protease YdiL (CAAX protease family)
MGDVAAGILLSLVLSILVSSVVYSVVGSDAFDDLELWATALLQVPLWLALVGVPVVATRFKGRRSLARDFGLTMRWSDIPLGLGLGSASDRTRHRAAARLPPLRDRPRPGGRLGAGPRRPRHERVGVVLVLLIAAVGAPIVEELFYRGLFLRSVQRRFGDRAAGGRARGGVRAPHFQLFDLLALVLFGIVVGVLVLRQGRLGMAIWTHVAFNLTAAPEPPVPLREPPSEGASRDVLRPSRGFAKFGG